MRSPLSRFAFGAQVHDREWLESQGFTYYGVIYGKPQYTGKAYQWMDNRPVKGTTYLGRFTRLEKKTTEIEGFSD